MVEVVSRGNSSSDISENMFMYGLDSALASSR
jgi:hypothetical protein